MKLASFVLSIISTTVALATAFAVAWLYLEKKVKYITTEENIQ